MLLLDCRRLSTIIEFETSLMVSFHNVVTNILKMQTGRKSATLILMLKYAPFHIPMHLQQLYDIGPNFLLLILT
jgi:hypothetical protein